MYCKDPYDIERYHALRSLAARIMASHTGIDATRIESLFSAQTGYATPKVGVRAAVFDEMGRILMVQETVDGGRWTLPGGWAEVNQTAAESAIREVREESGYRAEAVKLAAVWDRTRQGHAPEAFSVVRMFFVCRLLGGEPATSLETSGCGWFAEHEIPENLSTSRTLPKQIAKMFAHWRNPELPTEFE
jgi:ADP-ribose pyrophosphatase YjhB (NUDIX family)